MVRDLRSILLCVGVKVLELLVYRLYTYPTLEPTSVFNGRWKSGIITEIRNKLCYIMFLH